MNLSRQAGQIPWDGSSFSLPGLIVFLHQAQITLHCSSFFSIAPDPFLRRLSVQNNRLRVRQHTGVSAFLFKRFTRRQALVFLRSLCSFHGLPRQKSAGLEQIAVPLTRRERLGVGSVSVRHMGDHIESAATWLEPKTTVRICFTTRTHRFATRRCDGSLPQGLPYTAAAVVSRTIHVVDVLQEVGDFF